MVQRSLLYEFAMGVFGGGLIFASIFFAAYGIDILSVYLSTTETSPFISTVLKWVARLVYAVSFVYLSLLFVGLVSGIRGKGGSSDG